MDSGAITHAVKKGFITGIKLDKDSKPDFCEPCANAKSARQPFLKESKTRATNYRECMHWDLWGPASVKSLNGNSYVAAQIDNATRETHTSKNRKARLLSHTKLMKPTSILKLEIKLKSCAQIEGEKDRKSVV